MKYVYASRMGHVEQLVNALNLEAIDHFIEESTPDQN